MQTSQSIQQKSIISASNRQYSYQRELWVQLLRNKLAVIGLVVIAVEILLAIGAPLIARFDPVDMNARDAFQGPNANYILGTDELGRDLFSRVAFGARISIGAGFISVTIALMIGTLLGLLSGYFLGVADLIIVRLMDVLTVFPGLLLALVFIAIFGPGIDRAMLAIGLVYIPSFTRVCRSSTLVEREKLYVDASRAVGASTWRIILRHILPNVLAPLIVQASLCMSYAILTEAGLSFLGLGAQPPTPSWGVMLSKGREFLDHSIWIAFWPGLATMLTVFSFNLLGDGLRDALDPRLRES